MEIVGTFDDGLDVLKFLQHNRVDAIFLDINIPSLDGVLLAQNINQFAHKPFIVFITAWKEHAVEAFELEAFDYSQALPGVAHCQHAAKAGSRLAAAERPAAPAQRYGKTTPLIWSKMSASS
jgi:two-component system LytT family response regulator